MTVLMKYGCGMTAPEFGANHTHEYECIVPVTTPEVVEALDGEVLKDATIRDKRGRYRNGDFIVIPVSDGGSET